jgi:hypothetical protein
LPSIFIIDFSKSQHHSKRGRVWKPTFTLLNVNILIDSRNLIYWTKLVMNQFYVALMSLILPYGILWPTGSGGHSPRGSNTGAATARPLKCKNIQKIICQLSSTTRRTAGLKWTTEFKVMECDVSKTGCRIRGLWEQWNRGGVLVCQGSSQNTVSIYCWNLWTLMNIAGSYQNVGSIFEHIDYDVTNWSASFVNELGILLWKVINGRRYKEWETKKIIENSSGHTCRY